MPGKTHGGAALIASQFPLSFYLHSSSHCLNLSIVKSLEVASIHNMIRVVNTVSIFFSAHTKWQEKLEDAIDTTQPESSVSKLKDLCCTRWIEQIDALDRFQALHPSIIACMESISSEGSSNWSHESLTDSCILLLAITTTDFLSALVITNACLNYFLALTRSLQAVVKDIIQAVSAVNNIKEALHDVWDNKACPRLICFSALPNLISKPVPCEAHWCALMCFGMSTLLILHIME